jgi:hypothetical protein
VSQSTGHKKELEKMFAHVAESARFVLEYTGGQQEEEGTLGLSLWRVITQDPGMQMEGQ